MIMAAPTVPANPPELEITLKTLWGATIMPFGPGVQKPYAAPGFQRARQRLEKLVGARACGLLHGPHGVGKTLLVQHFLQALPEKRYRSFVLSHSSVTGSDLLRLLCSALGQTPRMRRSDNVCSSVRPGSNWTASGRCWCSMRLKISVSPRWKKSAC